MKRVGNKFLSILLALTVIFSSIPLSASAAFHTAGTTYYISSSEGDNANNGLSPDTPWADFTNVNSKVFSPGDQILLKCGDVWNQVFQPAGGNGTKDAPIVISSYGTGNRPVIEGASTYSNTLVIQNGSYCTLRGLEFRNAKMGPQFLYDTLQNEGIVIEDNYIHDLVGGPDAIALHVRCDSYDVVPEDTDDAWIAKNVRIENNDIGPTNSYGIVVMNSNTQAKANAFQNVMVKNNRLCSVSAKAIVFQCVKDSYWLGNYVDDAANAAQQGGTTASFLFRTENMHISNNIFINTPDTQSSDQSAVDSEGQNEFTHYTGNYFGNNYGGAIEFLMINGEIPPRYGEDYNRNHEICGNTFSANHIGALWATTDTGTTSGSITQNIYYENNLLRDPEKFAQWETVNENTAVSAESKIYNSGMDYSGETQRGWSYEKKDGEYVPLSFQEELQLWGNEDAFVSQFSMKSSSGWISRTWTAPFDGTIAVSGQAAIGKEEDIAEIRITKNGNSIDGTEQMVNTQEGTQTNYQEIQVYAGDVLRFESSGSEVYWIPTVAYTQGGYPSEDADDVPAAVTDLTVSEKSHNMAVIQWTAPGRDGNTGTASKYEIRYSTEEITEDNFEQAQRVDNVPFPAEAGETQQVEISMLEGNTQYYFAIKTGNEIPNYSVISNIASCKTDADVTELQNPGFEDGMNSWTVQGASAEVRYGDSHSGANAVYVSDRVDSWGSVVQDVTGVLKANGPGTYNFGVWARFANTSSRAIVTINYTDDQGNYWVTSHDDDGTGQGVQISTTEYTEINATRNITWTGEIQSATIYFQSLGSTDPVYLDDFFLTPSEDQVDRGNLSSAINRGKNVDSDEYTEESFSNLTSLLKDAEEVMKKETASQEEVDMACDLLNAAISSLEKPSYQPEAALQNPGFEEGIEPWTDNGGAGAILSIRTDKTHSGNQALYITNRGDSWHGAVQTVTDILNAAGPGLYQFGTWAMYEKQSSRAVVTLSWNDGSGHYVTSHEYENGGQGVQVSNEEFTEICGVREILWDGTLTDAAIYFQSMQGGGNTDNLTLDDFFLLKIHKTPLITLYNQNKNREQGDASDEKFAIFTQAISQAQTVIADSQSTQAVIDEAKSQLERAINGLASDGPDKYDLNQLIQKVDALDAGAYTDSTYQDVLAKWKVAKAVEEDPYATQKGVNLACEGLQSALEALQEKADKEALQERYEKEKGRQPEDSNQRKWEAFILTLENAQTVLEDGEASQSQVDAALNALDHAASALQEQPVPTLANPGFEEGEVGWKMPDWRSVVTEPGKVHSGSQALYVTGRWAEYIGPEQDVTALLNAAGPGVYDFGCWAMFENSDSTAQVVLTLNGTENILSKPADANTIQYVQVSDRQEITWEGQLTSAVLSFRSGNTNNDIYLDDFFLQKVEGADKSKLNALLEMYAFITEERYTETSFAAYQATKEQAESLAENPDASQEEIDRAADALKNAAESLQIMKKQPTDLSHLQQEFEKAKAFDEQNYTEETFRILKSKCNVADAVLQDLFALPDMAAVALDELQSAVNGLVKEETGNSESSSSSQEGDSSSENENNSSSQNDSQGESPATGYGTMPLVFAVVILTVAGFALLLLRKKARC